MHPAALGRILSQIRFGSTLNIAASLANPARPTHAVRGVYSANMVSLVAEVMLEIGYIRGMVVHGKDDRSGMGMDELSISGETEVLEFNLDGEQLSYTLRPEDVGLKTEDYEAIATTGNIEAERTRFIEVLSGRGHNACVDFTCYNAGAILYVSGCVQNMEDGVLQSRKAIENRSAIYKLKSWVCVQSSESDRGYERFEQAFKQAGIGVL